MNFSLVCYCCYCHYSFAFSNCTYPVIANNIYKYTAIVEFIFAFEIIWVRFFLFFTERYNKQAMWKLAMNYSLNFYSDMI